MILRSEGAKIAGLLEAFRDVARLVDKVLNLRAESNDLRDMTAFVAAQKKFYNSFIRRCRIFGFSSYLSALC